MKKIIKFLCIFLVCFSIGNSFVQAQDGDYCGTTDNTASNFIGGYINRIGLIQQTELQRLRMQDLTLF